MGRVAGIAVIVGGITAEIRSRATRAIDARFARFAARGPADVGRGTACAAETGFTPPAAVGGAAELVAGTTLALVRAGRDAGRVVIAAIVAVVRLGTFVGAVISFVCWAEYYVSLTYLVVEYGVEEIGSPSAAKGLTTSASLV